MNYKPRHWLLLVTNVPGQNQTLRMRIWRALKSAGAGLLRDGVYVLPETPDFEQVFEEQAREIRNVTGSAHILHFDASTNAQEKEFIALFDRSDDYVELLARLEAWQKKLPKFSEIEARKSLTIISREATAVKTTDIFPGKPAEQVSHAIDEAQTALNARFSPDEPQPARRKIVRRLIKDFQGKTWATRQRMWIDRVCSAWLIRRFIDPKAKFVWLANIKTKPKKAVGFDFDGAEFTHVDSKVTFEVLVTSFGLEDDVGLTRMGQLVHFLDVGGIPMAEAQGLAAIVAGARSLHPDDGALLLSVSPALDSLYQNYRVEFN
jgi:hypothetical protein